MAGVVLGEQGARHHEELVQSAEPWHATCSTLLMDQLLQHIRQLDTLTLAD